MDLVIYQLLSSLFSGWHRCKKNYKLSRIFCSLTFVKRHCFQRLTSCICHKSRKFTGKKILKKCWLFAMEVTFPKTVNIDQRLSWNLHSTSLFQWSGKQLRTNINCDMMLRFLLRENHLRQHFSLIQNLGN